MAGGDWLTFSVQQLIDCTDGQSEDSNAGCDGGNVELAFAYTRKTELAQEEFYPYEFKRTKEKDIEKYECEITNGHGKPVYGKKVKTAQKINFVKPRTKT